MPVIQAFLGLLRVLLTLLAGPYRVVMFKFRTFGGVGTGLLTWIGILAAYPALVLSSPPEDDSGRRIFLWSWLALVVWGYVQMFAKWCSSQPIRDEGSFHSWFGLLEPIVVLGLCMAASSFCGNGASRFVWVGYACSIAQVLIVRLQDRLDEWTPEDTRRLVQPMRLAKQRLTPVAVHGAGKAWSALRIGALSLIPFGLMLFRGSKIVFAKTVRATPAVAADGTAAYRPPSFWGRVTSYLVGHAVFSLLTGAIGVWGLLKGIGMILAIPAALILWLLGGKPDLPPYTKHEAKTVIERTLEIFKDKKDEAVERLERERPRWEEKYREEKAKLADEIERKKRQALWDFFTR